MTPRFTAVALESVSKRFGRERALVSVSLKLVPGRLCAVLGPNGAGKSTMVGILSTLVRPSAGRVRYETAAGTPEPREIRAAIGVLAHEAMVYGELTAVENLTFYATLYDLPDGAARARRLLDEVGLDEGARARPARTYSRGMLQRLALARALLNSPGLLLLDEPFTGLDTLGAAALVSALRAAKQADRILVVVTHDLDAIADLCDHLVVLRAGRVVLDEARAQPFAYGELKEKYLASLG